MLNNRNYCLNFVADLRRAVHCLQNGNLEGAKTFLDHAEKIYVGHIKPDSTTQTLTIEFDVLWTSLYNSVLSSEELSRNRFADKLLTFSSIVFSRTMKTYADN
jgi:hypothetical protein